MCKIWIFITLDYKLLDDHNRYFALFFHKFGWFQTLDLVDEQMLLYLYRPGVDEAVLQTVLSLVD